MSADKPLGTLGVEGAVEAVTTEMIVVSLDKMSLISELRSWSRWFNSCSCCSRKAILSVGSWSIASNWGEWNCSFPEAEEGVSDCSSEASRARAENLEGMMKSQIPVLKGGTCSSVRATACKSTRKSGGPNYRSRRAQLGVTRLAGNPKFIIINTIEHKTHLAGNPKRTG